MLHGITLEQGHWLHVRDDIPEKMNNFRMFSYKFLASGALILGINSLLIIKPLGPLLQLL